MTYRYVRAIIIVYHVNALMSLNQVIMTSHLERLHCFEIFTVHEIKYFIEIKSSSFNYSIWVYTRNNYQSYDDDTYGFVISKLYALNRKRIIM